MTGRAPAARRHFGLTGKPRKIIYYVTCSAFHNSNSGTTAVGALKIHAPENSRSTAAVAPPQEETSQRALASEFGIRLWRRRNETRDGHRSEAVHRVLRLSDVMQGGARNPSRRILRPAAQTRRRALPDDAADPAAGTVQPLQRRAVR